MKNSFGRRKFMQLSALGLAGAMLDTRMGFSFFTPPPVRHLGLQLWSVRDDMGKDPAGTIKALAKMGYREVESFGYNDGKIFGIQFNEFLKLLKDNGISMPSSHSPVTIKDYDPATKQISDTVKKNIDAAVTAGQKYIINPWMAEAERPMIDKLIPAFNAAAKYAKSAGIRYGYHNHNFEFEQRGPDGRLLIEWLLHETDPRELAFEMDLYWVNKAGHNPLDWFRIYPGRWELCHAKDMAKTDKKETCEVGDGSINFNEIFEHRAQAGLQYYIIELENYVTTPMQGVDRSLQGFKKLNF